VRRAGGDAVLQFAIADGCTVEHWLKPSTQVAGSDRTTGFRVPLIDGELYAQHVSRLQVVEDALPSYRTERLPDETFASPVVRRFLIPIAGDTYGSRCPTGTSCVIRACRTSQARG
jgi:hypothetical protein